MEEGVVGPGATARAAVESAEDRVRAVRDRVRRLELDREAAERETAETTVRVHSLEEEQLQQAYLRRHGRPPPNG